MRDDVLLSQFADGFAVQSFHCVHQVRPAVDFISSGDDVICQLFGLGGEMGTEESDMNLFGAVCWIETIDEESEVD
jgi:hypothetical protein